MPLTPQVQPLSRRTRRITFGLFFVIFVASLPFLYLYATGYRFDLGERANFIGTGGMYIAAERTGAEIYIDGELVKETRVFRRAFYAQNLEPGTHRVHVQKDAHHTWVKELPVSQHLVTEAQAFNLPIVSQVRVVSKWQSATGTVVVSTPLVRASSTNELLATTTKSTSKFTPNPEFTSLSLLFGTTSTSTTITVRQQALELAEKIFSATTTATSTDTEATTTKEWGNVRLFESGEDIYARWIGPRENVPYYYCSEEFPPYSTTTVLDAIELEEIPEPQANPEPEAFVHPVQTVPEDVACDPVIKMDRKSQTIHDFDFYPGSIDLIVMSLDDGIYVAEVDDRGWQNIQPLILGEKLRMRVSNGQIYVYDGTLIYHIILEEY